MLDQNIITLEAFAERIRLKRRTVADPRWRRKMRLPLVRVGRHIIGVREADVRRLIRRERLESPNGGGAA